MLKSSFDSTKFVTWMKINWLLVLFLALLASPFIFLRSTPTDFNSITELDGVLADGQPVVLEFYSNL